MECDGGPDHNLTFLLDQLSLLGLFLVGGMDKLTSTRGCPGLSYLNTAERPMSNLNRGISSLSLMMDPNTPAWLRELLHGVVSMKGVRMILAEYDDVLQHVIDVLERRVEKMNVSNTQNNEADDARNYTNEAYASKVGNAQSNDADDDIEDDNR